MIAMTNVNTVGPKLGRKFLENIGAWEPAGKIGSPPLAETVPDDEVIGRSEEVFPSSILKCVGLFSVIQILIRVADSPKLGS